MKSSQKPYRVFGLTGGIASGKSTAADLFQKKGVPVVDADKIAREFRDQDPRTRQLIQNRFGTTDRKKLREIVFKSPEARRDLEAILHPLILSESQKRLETEALQIKNKKTGPISKYPIILYEAALLVETGRHEAFDGLIVVEVSHDVQIERLMKRDTISKEEAENIIQVQTSTEKRRQAADFIITNDHDLLSLENQVDGVIQKLIAHKVTTQ
jgi:dephospho-CoA kinase